MLEKGSWMRYIALGAKIMPFEWVLFYVVFPWMITLMPDAVQELFAKNAFR